MTPFFRKLLTGTGLTRRNALVKATRAIQQALVQPVGAPIAKPPAARERAHSSFSGGAVGERGEREATAAGRFDVGSFTGPSGTRSYKLFAPAGFEGEALPLVVMLHGCTQSPDDFAAGTRMNALAQEQGLFVLYPEQAARSNAHKCWNWFVPGDQRRGQGEPALIAGMTRQVMTRHDVDHDRVYVAGLSAGGAMAAILAREYPDLFAAAGIHSGLPAGAAHDVASAFAAMQSGASSAAPGWAGMAPAAARTPLAAWPSVAPREPTAPIGADAAQGAPLIVFHGDADATVNARNGARVVDAALGSASWQASRDGAAGGATPGRTFTRIVYRDTDGPAGSPSRAEHWVVHGAAHAWSGGDSAGSFTESGGPDASREMLRFFAEHPLRHESAKAVAA